MEYSKIYIPTLKENIQENEPLNYRLLNKAGYIRKSAAGIYGLLPLGAMTLDKLQKLIASHLEDRNCFGIKLAANHTMEDAFKLLVTGQMSHKELPIGGWYLKEQSALAIRPRLGLLHPRAWQSLQGFKLVHDEEELNTEFAALHIAFRQIVKALQAEFVEADRLSEHFLGNKDLIIFWPYSSGEERAIRCTKCERITTPDSLSCPHKESALGSEEILKMVYTPAVKTIQDVASFLEKKAEDIVKTLIYKADDELIGVLIRGDRELSEIKLKTVLGCSTLTQANAEEVQEATGAEVGFAGPIGLKTKIICDYEAAAMKSVVVGANKTDHHYINACINRDFKADIIADVRCADSEDICDQCGGSIEIINGFTLARLNKRGKAYSEKQGFTFINKNGTADFTHIVEFDFNLYRLLAAAVENNNDEAGICMPNSIAPFDIVVMPVHADNEQQTSAALEIYKLLQEQGFNVLLDDRSDRVSSKFKDSELIGIPLRITVGRKIAENIVELKPRRGDMQEIVFNDIMEYITKNEV